MEILLPAQLSFSVAFIKVSDLCFSFDLLFWKRLLVKLLTDRQNGSLGTGILRAPPAYKSGEVLPVQTRELSGLGYFLKQLHQT